MQASHDHGRISGFAGKRRVLTEGTERIANREALEERFSGWPSFHDAEVLAVRLDNGDGSDGRPSVELDVHVFVMTREVNEDGKYVLRSHTLVTLRFEGVRDVELYYFARQNVLFEMTFEWLDDVDDPARLKVDLPSSVGLEGGLRCERATVLAVEPFEPGPHSVYHT